MGAMKEIYTETQDLREAAQELDAEAFNTYVEQMGWKSSTEIKAHQRRFLERATAGMTLLYLIDGDANNPSPATVAAAQIMDAGCEALGFDRQDFYRQITEGVAQNVQTFREAGAEGGAGD